MSNISSSSSHRAENNARSSADALLESLSIIWSSGVAGWRTAESDEQSKAVDEEARYRALVEQIPAVVFMAYLDRTAPSRAFISPHIETALGYSQEEWLDDPVHWYNRIHPDDRVRWSLEAAQTLVSGKPLRAVYRVIARDGRTIWLQCEVKTRCRESGEPWFIHGVAFDISDLKETEEKLQRARDELEQRVLERTRALETEVELRKRSECSLAENLERLRSLYQTASAVSRACSVDEVFGVALRALGAALKSDRSSVLLFDSEGVMRFMASAGLSFEYRSAVEGHSPWNRSSQNPKPIVVRDVEEEPSLREFRSIILNEGIRALAFIPLLGEARLIGKLMAYYDVPHDFTESEIQFAETIASHIGFAIEKKQAEVERANLLLREQAARAEAEQANRLKDQFIATASHELRTPLSAIMGWTHLLQTGRLDESNREKAITVIERNAKAQARIVDEILDVSRITSGKIQLDLQAMDLATVVDAAVEAIRPEAEAKGVVLHSQFLPASGTVRGDPHRLQQVVGNVLSNAVKFTGPGGRIMLTLSYSDSSAELLVSDTGKGIPADVLPYIFEPFRQADGSASRNQGGLGLGLAIVKHLIGMHGGTIRAESAGEGKGTTFSITLPVVPFGGATESASGRLDRELGATHSGRDSPLHGLRVLVVEDEDDAREFVALTLAQRGANVTVAASVGDALSCMQNGKPDVLLSDIGLPGEDGWSLIEIIRSSESGPEDSMPAIALTGYAAPADRERSLGAGYNAYLTKPVDAATLVSAIADVVSPHKHRPNPVRSHMSR